MAQRVIVTLEDDIDGTKADETVQYALDGVNYEIDLSNKNAEKLRKALSDWVGHSRRTGGRKVAGTSKAPTGKRDPEQSKAIRAWARENGVQCPDRGRIPDAVVQQWEDAHKK